MRGEKEKREEPRSARIAIPRCGVYAASMQSRSGYIALLSILMVAAIAASTVLILFTTSVNQVQNAADTERGLAALMAANACAERALEYIRESGSVNEDNIKLAVGTQTVGIGECIINSFAPLPNGNYAIRAKGSVIDGDESVEKIVRVQVSVTTDAALSLLSWEELAS